MSSRMRKPETALLQISRGDWLLVKKRLTHGEQRQMFARMTTPNALGHPAVVTTMPRVSKVMSYLLDWSITDADDKPVPIMDQPEDSVLAALDALDPDDFTEIHNAIEAHMAKIEKEDAERKKRLDGAPESLLDSPSVSNLVGAMSGSTS